MLNLYFSEGCRDGTGTAALTPTTPEPTTFFFLLLSSSVSTALGSSLTWPKARSHFLGEDPAKKVDRNRRSRGLPPRATTTREDKAGAIREASTMLEAGMRARPYLIVVQENQPEELARLAQDV